MAIITHRLSTGSIIILSDSEESTKNLKQLISRALNTWTDAPPELKILGDLATHGKVMQDYYAQDTSKPRPD